jgi:hypothetical protein
VKRALNSINTQKAAGPDKIRGQLLKSCKDSLFDIIYNIFKLSFATCTYPACWKVGEIVPVSKKDLPRVDNDLRPVTLTAILSKCLEKVGLSLLMPYVKDHFDPFQFAYINGRSTEDAICTMMHKITKHLDAKSTNTARALFIDYSSAFNTIQPHLMLKKLNILQVPGYLQLWILDYLTERPQYVRTSHETSNRIILNTGAPQGCVLSPILFVLYTNDLCWKSDSVFIVKYADDTIIGALICNNDDSEYMECIKFVTTWCKDNFLDLNVSKTKEVIWDYRRLPSVKQPVVIENLHVEVTSVYKYLGLLIDNKFNFAQHVELQLKKANKRMYCIRSMKNLNVNSDIIAMFFNSTIPSILMYASTAFYGMITKYLKSELDRPRKTCDRLLSKKYSDTLYDNTDLHKEKTLKMANKVIMGSQHPLKSDFVLMPSGYRYRMPFVRTNRYKSTFVPSAINILNDELIR